MGSWRRLEPSVASHQGNDRIAKTTSPRPDDLPDEVRGGGRDPVRRLGPPPTGRAVIRVSILVAGTAVVAALLHVAHLDVMLLAPIPIALALLVPISSPFVVRLVMRISISSCTNFLAAWLLGLAALLLVLVAPVRFLALPRAYASTSPGWCRLSRISSGRQIPVNSCGPTST